jgi:hypothetical protein
MALAEKSLTSPEALRAREKLFLPSCSKCQDGVDVAKDILDRGLNVEGGQIEWTVRVDSVDGRSAVATVTRTIGPIRLIDKTGSLVQEAPQSDAVTEVYQLTKGLDGKWVISSIDPLP